jgi:hypothetical protein
MGGAVTALQAVPEKPVLTVREAAGLLGVNVKTL